WSQDVDDDRQYDRDSDYESSDGETVLSGFDEGIQHSDDRQTRLWLEVSMDLRGLVWDDSFLAISREARYLGEMRREAMEELIAVYFERRLLLARILSHESGTERDLLLIELDGLTAQLDALTGGWFSSELAQRGLSVPPLLD
ncbi:MAG: hypothetical protein KC561_21220, partial [Myxococcales bacterium]|nr:hypothetical protein [Myxococcales bacterium]